MVHFSLFFSFCGVCGVLGLFVRILGNDYINSCFVSTVSKKIKFPFFHTIVDTVGINYLL